MDDEAKRWLQKVATESKHGIDSSAVFLGLWDKDIEEDPVPVLQIGYALITGKPMGFLVPKGLELPTKVKAIADSVAWFDPGDEKSMLQAVAKLTKELESFIKEEED